MNTAKNLIHSDNSVLKTATFKTLEGYCFGFDGSKCEECGGKCCAGESGYVFLSIVEMQEIARFLGIEFEVFTQIYVRKVGYKFSLLEKIPKMQDSKNQRDKIYRILDSNQPNRVIESTDSINQKNVEYAREADVSGGEVGFTPTQAIQSEGTESQTTNGIIESTNLNPQKTPSMCAQAKAKWDSLPRDDTINGVGVGWSEIHSRAGDASNGIECIFFENGKCAIYPVRPKQCRDFPFWESHKILDADSKKALALECKGIIFFS